VRVQTGDPAARNVAAGLRRIVAVEGGCSGWVRGSVSPFSFRSESGRNYAKVFRQLLVETTRLKREQKRRVVMYIITHGQCHIEPELITAMKQQAFLYGIVCLPSSDQLPEFVPLLARSQIVHADALTSRAESQRRALDIVGDATRSPSATSPRPPRR